MRKAGSARLPDWLAGRLTAASDGTRRRTTSRPQGHGRAVPLPAAAAAAWTSAYQTGVALQGTQGTGSVAAPGVVLGVQGQGACPLLPLPHHTRPGRACRATLPLLLQQAHYLPLPLCPLGPQPRARGGLACSSPSSSCPLPRPCPRHKQHHPQ